MSRLICNIVGITPCSGNGARDISDLGYHRKSMDSQTLNEDDAMGGRGYNLFSSLCPSPLPGPFAVPLLMLL